MPCPRAAAGNPSSLIQPQPEAAFGEIQKLLAQAYKEIDQDEKQSLDIESAKLKAAYESDLKVRVGIRRSPGGHTSKLPPQPAHLRPHGLLRASS